MSSSSSPAGLPDDVLAGILRRLPARSLATSRRVCNSSNSGTFSPTRYTASSSTTAATARHASSPDQPQYPCLGSTADSTSSIPRPRASDERTVEHRAGPLQRFGPHVMLKFLKAKRAL
ncbi:hypothetical protein PR202_ga22689 [Eleusine coracana subsp. coracana]|uniref:F-box domain-containing protein n=1 Tax=Eleusine coracana subsp. coracana TaxID=191504 RepID=A0AAV5D3X8_ELECO|nr:hypothetical protein PR202_ga22689 [Eleusine coracana subsp. coracana]